MREHDEAKQDPDAAVGSAFRFIGVRANDPRDKKFTVSSELGIAEGRFPLLVL